MHTCQSGIPSPLVCCSICWWCCWLAGTSSTFSGWVGWGRSRVRSSSGDPGVAVGGAVSSLVLRRRAAERRVLGRLEKKIKEGESGGNDSTVSCQYSYTYLFLDRLALFSGGEGEGARPLLRVPRSRRPIEKYVDNKVQSARCRAQAKKAKDDCKININQLTCVRSLRLKMKGSRKVAMTDANKRRNGKKTNKQ